MNKPIYDIAIIGGGPAGVSAGVYAARKRLNTVFITKDFLGQSSVSEDIQNWIGTPHISGTDLSKNLKAHLEEYKGDHVVIAEDHWVKSVTKNGETDAIPEFTITTDKDTFTAKSVLITAGSKRRKLEVPGAEIFDNKGLTYCASCDGPLFADADVAVIGGGNAALETSLQLLAYCKSVTLLNRSDVLRGDAITVEKVSSHPNMRVLKNVEIKEVLGDKYVTGLTYFDKVKNQNMTLDVTGIFVEIGLIPNTDLVKNLVKMDTYNHIVVDARTQKTSLPGIWAAGDCTDGLYHQNNIASGDAVKALEDIYLYLKKN